MSQNSNLRWTKIIMFTGAALLLGGCIEEAPKPGTCGLPGQSYSMCDLSMKTDQLELRVENKEERLRAMQQTIQTQQKRLDEFNATLNSQNAIAQKLLQVAYAQKQISQQLKQQQQGADVVSVESSSRAKTVELSQAKKSEAAKPKTPSKLQVVKKTAPDVSAAATPEIRHNDSQEQRFSPATFKLKTDADVFGKPDRSVQVASWKEGDLFTAFIRLGEMIRISGYFPEGAAWSPAPRPLWVHESDVTRLQR